MKCFVSVPSYLETWYLLPRQMMSSLSTLENMASELSVEETAIEVDLRNGQTLYHPLVLLEGDCHRKKKNEKSKLYEKTQHVDKFSVSTKDKYSSSSAMDHVLVETRTKCTKWPIVDDAFKALVVLIPGSNLLKVKVCLDGEWRHKELSLIYQPLQLERFVRVVYIKCRDSDGTFQAPPGSSCDIDVARQKLAFNARLLQSFTAHNLYKHGLGYQTFRLEEDTEGEPLVHVFTTALCMEEALALSGGQLYDRFHQELVNSSLYDKNCKLWAFMSFTRYNPPLPEEFNEKDIPMYVKGHTALGGGSLALFGTGGLHTWASCIEEVWPCFTDTRMIDKRTLFDDSSRRGTYWANYATCLGAAMHELGHCFDLAHTPAGIMGRGFDDINLVFTLQTTLQKKSSSGSGEIHHNEVKPTFNDSKPDDNKASEHNVKRLKVTHDAGSYQSQDTAASLLPPDWTSQTSNFSTQSAAQEACTSLPRPISALSRPVVWSHGAHWYRSSAVVLRYHKWLSSAPSQDNFKKHNPVVHWGHDVCGPVGNCGSFAQPDQSPFNDRTWLANQEMELDGYVIFANKYVNFVQTLGKDKKEGKVISQPRGTEAAGRRYVFQFTSPDERLTSIDVRAGGWVDAIRLHTNFKSSVWMGGSGGDLYELRPPEGRRMVGLFGTAGKYVGSIGALLDSHKPSEDEDLIIESPRGLRLVELQNKKYGEVYKHWEFLQDPPSRLALPRKDIVQDQATIQIIDDAGNICRAGCGYDYTDVLAGTVPARVSPPINSSDP
ncbi:uncharacterized protein LOC5519572 isoform X2 [Nematostella vectensis]|uniref:uncharacterized protein LOC5519572 isoform X2 n=1 Tax=Nematostella vectensis TaxID=45351 RepID=UPI0020779AB2|nr:uncharacterized protein LOC5519572 isoform X2 [Nematostella vectensis]